jgi:hypothetical protein
VFSNVPRAGIGSTRHSLGVGLEPLSTDELVGRYVPAATRHGEATLGGDRAANAEADLIAAVYRELRRRGAESTLLGLLDSPDKGVRSWSAPTPWSSHRSKLSPSSLRSPNRRM